MQILRGYKFAISPWFDGACRFQPTCSEYAMYAVEQYGAVRGGIMAISRVMRCHPFCAGGYDPVHANLANNATPDRSFTD